ncbi:long-chain-fatty-acid--CoA ligase [Streptomyces achromogenes]|uniref:long-chain-fatty-acid--CoA ligase n=1 Tax=Streptomyces achromogenes TaxID=67255 RepID=UPI00367B99F6
MHSTMQDVPLSIARIMRHSVRTHGGTAVGTWHGDRFVYTTYAAVGARAARLAHALGDRLSIRTGKRPQERQSVVATLMWNNSRHLEVFLAVPSMGAVLHTLNLRMDARQLAYIINHAGDEVVVVDQSLVGLLGNVVRDVTPSLRHIVVAGEGDWGPLSGFDGEVHDYEELLAGRPDAYPWADELDERTAAVMCYTSGTSGEPKGVVYSHRALYLQLLHLISPDGWHISARDTVLPVVPMFHVNGWSLPHAAAHTGAALLLPDRHVQPATLARMIQDGGPSFAAGVPAVWTALLEELRQSRYDISSLRRVAAGGSACPPALMREYQERYGVELVHSWGMTETLGLASAAVPPARPAGDGEWPYRFTQGRFPSLVEYRLTGPDGARIPHDGESTGELELRGPTITGAYHGGVEDGPIRPEGSFSPDGWLRTGDIGRVSPDGYLSLTDRSKDVVKSGGEFISSIHLENVLLEHPAVFEAAVIAVPDPRWGERPLAVVALHEGADVEVSELSAFLAARVTPAWHVPEQWAVVGQVPKTAVGKNDKKLMRHQYAEGALPVVRSERPSAQRGV